MMMHAFALVATSSANQQEDEQQRQEGEKESFQLHALPLLLMRQERLHILDDRRNQVDDAVGDA